MKKIFLLIILLLSLLYNISYGDDRLDKPYNYGYAKRYGMVAITGNLTDKVSDEWGDIAPGGGAFFYYNILNKFWGNVAIGLSVDYIGGDFTTENQNIKGNAYMAPVALNVAYMTSSDIVNAWIGVGMSYNFANFSVSGGSYSVTTGEDDDAVTDTYYYNGFSSSQYLIGIDVFAGLEYLFTKDGRWGAFFEFRYTYAQNPKFSATLSNGSSISDSLDMQQLKYTVGFSYHF